MGFVRGEPIRLAAVIQIGHLSMGTKRKIWTTSSSRVLLLGVT